MKNHFAHIKKSVQQKLADHLPGYDQKYFILGVSGGPDSVLMAQVFKVLSLNFGIAHVNYGLRGKESEGDEKFVRSLAKELGVKCFVKKTGIKKTKGKSVQMLAREIRYTFFDTLLQKEKADVLVLAHHASDQAETVLLNFFRGCGIDGLTGMKALSGNKFRPLMDIPKTAILAAVEEKHFPFRTDNSNNKSDYKRNFLRNEVMPLLEQKWPGIEKTILENTERFVTLAEALKKTTAPFFDFTTNFGFTIGEFKNDPVLLHHFKERAAKSGFRLVDLEKLLNNKKTGSKTLRGPAGLLEKHGDRLSFMVIVSNPEQPSLEIKGNRVSVKIPEKKMLRSLSEEIDAKAIKGSLYLRPWQVGDKMMPLGMRGFKKISDLLIDLKLPLSAKKQVQVLCDAEKIVWLVGFRIDERVKLKGVETSAGRVFLAVK